MAKLNHLMGLGYYFHKHRYWFRRPDFTARQSVRDGETS
jgi:hypothetical protein